MQVRKQQFELDMEQQIGSKYEKEYFKAATLMAESEKNQRGSLWMWKRRVKKLA